MRKNLLTLMLSLACIFLFIGNSLAETKIHDTNSVNTTNNLNVVKDTKLNRNALITKYKKLTQNCVALVDGCSDAFDHLAWASGYAYDGCNEYGWTSDYCGELANWLGETAVWAILQCNAAETEIKPQKAIPIDSRRQQALEKFSFNKLS